MKAATVLAMLALATVASANRGLLQTPAPAPAPGPASCPPKTSTAGSNCVVEATSFQSSCSSYISALQKATGGQVVASTPAQISSLVSQLKSSGATPTASCCSAATAMLSDACVCSSAVQAVAQSVQNLNATAFQTTGSVFLTACGQPTCVDTCQLPTASG